MSHIIKCMTTYNEYIKPLLKVCLNLPERQENVSVADGFVALSLIVSSYCVALFHVDPLDPPGRAWRSWKGRRAGSCCVPSPGC